jgi:hypothetical protein
MTGGRCRMEGKPADLLTSPDFVATFLGGAKRPLQ